MKEEESNGGELVPRKSEEVVQAGLFGAVPPARVVELATEVADSLAAVIKYRNLYTVIRNKAYVHVEAWQTCAAMLGVTAIVTDVSELRNEEGKLIGYAATAEARLLDGTIVGRGESMCTKEETGPRSPWPKADDYARKGMAQTRAMSRALRGPLGWIVVLAGYEPVSSEEMGSSGPTVVDGGRTDSAPIEWGGDPLVAQTLEGLFRRAQAVDAAAWTEAKIRATLAEASDDDRSSLVDELTEWLQENEGAE